MNPILTRLQEMAGTYSGEGINHENQPFNGRLEVSPRLGGRGIRLKFSATARDGTVYHEEESLIAPSLDETLTLWNFNTNVPGLVPHSLRRANSGEEHALTLIFGFHSPEDQSRFREEITLEIHDTKSLSYTYAWGLPGGDFKERSGVRMSKEDVGA